MKWEEMADAVNDAERTSSYLDSFVTKIAKLLIGRLRKANSHNILWSLKKRINSI